MVSYGNIERLTIVLITLLLGSILSKGKIAIIKSIPMILILFTIGFTIGNLCLFFYVNNEETTIYNSFTKDSQNDTAVILFAKGEPEIFDTITISKIIYDNSNLTGKLLAPLNIFKYKLSYEEMGSSKYVIKCNELKRTLQIRLGEEYDVYMRYLDIEPKLVKGFNFFSENYDRIIVVPLFLYDNSKLQDVFSIITNELIYSKTKVLFTPTLWESKKISKQVALKIAEIIPSNNRKLTGILILDNEITPNTEANNVLLGNVIDFLKAYEFDEDKVMYITGKNLNNIDVKIYSLREKGVNTVVIINISDIVQNIKEIKNIIDLIEKLSKDNINFRYINGWGIEEELINELEYQIRLKRLNTLN